MSSNNPFDGILSYSGFHKKTTFFNPDVDVVPSMGYDFDDVINATWECDWTEETFRLRDIYIGVGQFLTLGSIFQTKGTFYGEQSPNLYAFKRGSRGIISLVPHLKVSKDENGELGIKAEEGVMVHSKLPLIIVIDGIPKVVAVVVTLPTDRQ